MQDQTTSKSQIKTLNSFFKAKFTVMQFHQFISFTSHSEAHINTFMGLLLMLSRVTYSVQWAHTKKSIGQM